MATDLVNAGFSLLKRAAEDPDAKDPEPEVKEVFSSWALFILLSLLIIALFTSYILQRRKIQAVHETVLSIFAGMVVGLIIRLTNSHWVRDYVSFNYLFFFNLLLPPIILNSGYELHQANFFRHIGTILTFALLGTFISAVVLGVLMFIWTLVPLEGFHISFVEAIALGATLSATDPVTILAIFNTYKVDPKLYTIIFGESILNDAVAIVMFSTAQDYVKDGAKLSVFSFFEGVGKFLLTFGVSMLIGILVGLGTAVTLKYTHVRQYAKIETCLVILVAYATYYFSNACRMSGIVSLLFCGISLKHYAYYNMSRRTQLSTKFIFQILAQLTENFIFLYLGLTLSAEPKLAFKPLFILISIFGICVARWCAVFPLSRAINWFIRYRARKRGQPDQSEELPYSYQAMLFWAGLRGAVGVALAEGFTGANKETLKATVLVVVVLTVIIFGGTTARMLEILGIRTGVVEEIDSDDEFDIEVDGGTFYKRDGIGALPTGGRRSNGVSLSALHQRDGSAQNGFSSVYERRGSGDPTQKNLLGDTPPQASESDFGSDIDTSDLPPAVAPRRRPSPRPEHSPASHGEGITLSSTRAALGQLLRGSAEDHTEWFRQLDEGVIKPWVLLDGQQKGHNGSHHDGGSGSNSRA